VIQVDVIQVDVIFVDDLQVGVIQVDLIQFAHTVDDHKRELEQILRMEG
jgi:hypothetical protein